MAFRAGFKFWRVGLIIEYDMGYACYRRKRWTWLLEIHFNHSTALGTKTIFIMCAHAC